MLYLLGKFVKILHFFFQYEQLPEKNEDGYLHEKMNSVMANIISVTPIP